MDAQHQHYRSHTIAHTHTHIHMYSNFVLSFFICADFMSNKGYYNFPEGAENAGPEMQDLKMRHFLGMRRTVVVRYSEHRADMKGDNCASHAVE